MANEQISTRCCVVGGGPCGLMLGYLLARAGVDVVVLEKHADFLRDFRGDTIHPSTLDIMGELGLLDDFLKLPHHKEATLSAYFGGQQYAFADFRQLPTRCKFIALMPQWDFLNFLADRGKRYPSFHLRTRTEAVDLNQALDRGGRPARALASPGVAVHRRCRARDVAHRRSRRQSGGAGRGGGGEYPVAAAQGRDGDRGRPRPGREAANVSHPRHPAPSGFQNNVVDRALGPDKGIDAPLALRLMSRFAPLRRIPARIVGQGVRPEHVHSPESAAPAPVG